MIEIELVFTLNKVQRDLLNALSKSEKLINLHISNVHA